MHEEDKRTLWCGNLSSKVTEELLFELFLQAGPVEKVCMPKDKDGKSRAFAFITFKHEMSVPYAIKVMDGTSLFGCILSMQNHNLHQHSRLNIQQSPNKHLHRPGQHYQSHSMPVAVPIEIEQMIRAQAAAAAFIQVNVLNQSLTALQGMQPPNFAQFNVTSPQRQIHTHQRHASNYQEQSCHQQQNRHRDRLPSPHHRPSYHERNSQSRSRERPRVKSSRDETHREWPYEHSRRHSYSTTRPQL